MNQLSKRGFKNQTHYEIKDGLFSGMGHFIGWS
jgi:hypothetical protein